MTRAWVAMGIAALVCALALGLLAAEVCGGAHNPLCRACQSG
jgi:F0F1-type ATP synthase membrane subunit c/vacuolar-type H+-ATPase subunit K